MSMSTQRAGTRGVAIGGDADRGSWRRMLAVVVLAAAMLAMIASFVIAPSARADDKADDFSFYKLGSDMSSLYNNSMSPEKTDGKDIIGCSMSKEIAGTDGNMTNSGSFLGYADSNKSKVFLWNAVGSSSSDNQHDYRSLQNGVSDSCPDGATVNGLRSYGYFGAALHDLGLDSTSSSMGLNIGHKIAGGLMLLVYAVSSLIDGLFAGVVKILQLLNPFSWLESGMRNSNSTMAGVFLGQNPHDTPGALKGLASFVSGWYDALSSMSWGVIVPLLIAFLVVGLLIMRSADTGTKLRQFLVRLFFIALGVPLLGTMYTASLNKMFDVLGGNGATMSTQMVQRNYVDFGTWSMDYALYTTPGMKIGWDAGHNQATADARNGVRDTALEINQLPTRQAGGGQDIVAESGQTMAMIKHYMDGDKVNATDYEQKVKNAVQGSEYYKKNPDKVKGWFIDYVKPEGDDDTLKRDPSKDNPMLYTTSTRRLVQDPNNGNLLKWRQSANAGDGYCGVDQMLDRKNGTPGSCAMSPLSMYNYLNTKFDSTSMTVYSSDKSHSLNLRENHDYVTQVGTGVMSVVYWLNTMTMMLSALLIGVFYALGMLVGSIRDGLGIMMSIPFGLMGSLAGIARAIVLTITVIIEVVGTAFLYSFVQSLLVSLEQITTQPLQAVLQSNSTAPSLVAIAGNGFVTVALLLLETVLVAMFTFMALKLRKSVVSAVQDSSKGVIERFVGVGVTRPGAGGGLLRGAAAGAAGAAGMAGTNRILGGMSGGNDTAGSGRTDASSPDRVGPGPNGGTQVSNASNSSSTHSSGANGLTSVNGGDSALQIEGSAGDDGGEGPDGSLPGGPNDPADGGPNGSLSGGGFLESFDGSGTEGLSGSDDEDQRRYEDIQSRGGSLGLPEGSSVQPVSGADAARSGKDVAMGGDQAKDGKPGAKGAKGAKGAGKDAAASDEARSGSAAGAAGRGPRGARSGVARSGAAQQSRPTGRFRNGTWAQAGSQRPQSAVNKPARSTGQNLMARGDAVKAKASGPLGRFGGTTIKGTGAALHTVSHPVRTTSATTKNLVRSGWESSTVHPVRAEHHVSSAGRGDVRRTTLRSNEGPRKAGDSFRASRPQGVTTSGASSAVAPAPVVRQQPPARQRPAQPLAARQPVQRPASGSVEPQRRQTPSRTSDELRPAGERRQHRPRRL